MVGAIYRSRHRFNKTKPCYYLSSMKVPHVPKPLTEEGWAKRVSEMKKELRRLLVTIQKARKVRPNDTTRYKSGVAT